MNFPKLIEEGWISQPGLPTRARVGEKKERDRPAELGLSLGREELTEWGEGWVMGRKTGTHGSSWQFQVTLMV